MMEKYTEAINSGDVEAVVLCIKDGADVNFKFPDGYSALMTAAYYGHLKVVDALIQAGCNINEIIEWGFTSTALLVAADRGHVDVLQTLLDSGANTDITDENGKTALIKGASNGFELIVHRLIQKGVEIDATDKEGYTALMYASWNGGDAAVQALLEAGAVVNKLNNCGETALMKAACNGHTDIIQALLKNGADVNIAAEDGSTAFLDAAGQGKEDVAALLLDRGADMDVFETKYGRTALIKSAMYGNSGVMEMLVKRGADTNIADKYDLTALRAAAQTDRRWAVELLLQGGAHINAADKNGLTPLIIAAQNGYGRVIEALLAAGVNIAAQDKCGRTALDHAPEGWARDLLHAASIEAEAAAVLAAELAVKNEAAAKTQKVVDALTSALYAQYVLLLDLPLQMQDEQLTASIASARTERRMKDLKALKEQKEALGYAPSGLTAEQMREQLVVLKDQIGNRMEELMDADDDDGCIICDEYQVKVDDILSQNMSVSASGAPTMAAAQVMPVPGVAVNADCVVLQKNVSEGENSSGKSVILTALFTAAHTTEQVTVVVKLFDRSLISRAQKEYRMMVRLHESDPTHFVRPYAFIDGSLGGILAHQREDTAYCQACVCLVMEKGAVDMKEYFNGRSDMVVMEKLAVVRQLLDILIAARKAGIVLHDFKPANVVRVSDGRYDFRLKAIDFENSCVEGESMGDETTAAYGPPEVAKAALARARGESPAPLLSSHKMDIMALGWTVYEIANGMQSYWNNQSPPIVGDVAILNALGALKDDDVHRNIESTFPGDQFAPLRTWLFHALRVNPRERATADELQHSHSLFGSKDRTLDTNTLLSQIGLKIDQSTEKVLEQGNEILSRIEELSEQLESSLSVFGASLDAIAARIVLGAEQHSSDMHSLGLALEEQKLKLEQGGILDQQILEASIVAAMSKMDASLRDEISSSIKGVIASSSSEDPSQSDKLNALMSMVKDLQGQTDRLHSEFNEFARLSESQMELLTLLEKSDNHMPLTFVILPACEASEKLPPSASMVDKMINSARRKKSQVMDLVWARSRVVFICPITLQQVPCGPLGKGYEFKIPSDLVKALIPALKWGIIFLKVALATQGLGGVVPNLDMLTNIDTSMLDSMAAQMTCAAAEFSSFVGDAATAASTALADVQFNEDQAKAAYSHVFQFIQEQERGGPGWKPQKTGLVLTEAPLGKGRSMWVSPGAVERFQLEGNDAIKKIGLK